jgi:AraC family transcriptional regulator of adaptative response/methylated-DNA-[protein]-cysteine methyltransferase
MDGQQEISEILDAEQCWQAVLARSREADGTFVYAVRSTRIYCRPSCPSRRPGREQVVFFSQPGSAEVEGFRACRRCRPQAPSAQAEAVKRACRYMEQHPEERLDLETLSLHADLSPAHLQKVFKRMVGVSPREYADACRMGRFKGRLRSSETVTAAIYEAGYGSSSRVYERAASQMGMSPSHYRLGGSGMRIRYSVTGSPLGRLLVAATEKGVCSVSLGDSDAELETSLSREFPGAVIHRDDAEVKPWIDTLLRHLEGPPQHLDLPLDVQATAFQWRVWTELKNIPYGSTRSYGKIAEAIGQPGAARAVARACAGNRAALVIPCHRVVRTDGRPAGYRWGAKRKRALLEMEKKGGLGQ